MRNTLIEISNHRGTHFRSNLCLVMFGEPTTVSITDCMLGKSRHRRTSKGALLRMSKSWIIVCWRVWSTSLSRVLSPFKVDPQGSSVKPNWESTGESWYRCPVSADEGSSRKGSGREGLPRTRDFFFFFSTLTFYKTSLGNQEEADSHEWEGNRLKVY